MQQLVGASNIARNKAKALAVALEKHDQYKKAIETVLKSSDTRLCV